jgi:zinc transporter ZupT
MLAAWLLTAAALAGIVLGMLGRPPNAGSLLTAAAGGLLVGICLFWVFPEIAASVGWIAAIPLVLAVFGLLLILDNTLLHHGHDLPLHSHGASRSLLIPLLIATAIHSFLDGWSVRALSASVLDRIAVGIGLGLHKIPEGIAVGWVVRRGLGRNAPAFGAAAAAELATLIGAWVEPRAAASGYTLFGPWANALVLAVVAGMFLFLGMHAIADERKNIRALGVFLATFVAVGALSLTGSRI